MPARPARLNALLQSMRLAVHQGRGKLTTYAREGLAELGWQEHDLHLQLLDLTTDDFLRTEPSARDPLEIIWVFTPELWDDQWIRIVERDSVVIISFHRG